MASTTVTTAGAGLECKADISGHQVRKPSDANTASAASSSTSTPHIERALVQSTAVSNAVHASPSKTTATATATAKPRKRIRLVIPRKRKRKLDAIHHDDENTTQVHNQRVCPPRSSPLQQTTPSVHDRDACGFPPVLKKPKLNDTRACTNTNTNFNPPP
eukprot:CAMPEP_0202710092 /NCGR_PEP_ID=MMETSP1385-20130828/22121_1 /ASSEMBLY_ACC=CAM_ASM_000861 /TAXON_ID=933848 /ORGANISM="Elphidium margaritaceum" /LENGTH=159 /DNA_ID=CAMNT_0049369523 /DNA_START=75 /DNA_END=550 /DNA_ORIENTATION=+